jgi:hypothetical protein
MPLQPVRARLFSARALCLIALAMLAGAMLARMEQKAAQAAQAPILWGAYIKGAPWDTSKLDAFEARAGKGASILHWGQPWYHDGAYQPFYAGDFQAVRDHGSIPMLDWGSWDYCCGPDQPRFRLATIIGGDHDAYITRWAQSARAWGHPFFLRFDHEMNGWWQFAWSEQLNNNRPGEFAAAWRHVHDIFVQQGATNATWVWCPNITSARSTPLTTLYPGDSYVDWTCMDGYNWGTDKGNRWQSFAEVFGGSADNDYHNTYQELLDLAPNKPIMIGEVATSDKGGDPGAWVRDALTRQLPTNFPQIKAVVWFNWDADDPGLSWPIESSPSTLAGFAQSIGSSYFAGNQFSRLGSGPIAAPGGDLPIVAADPPDLARP